jgi:hypothetical protein
MTLKALPDPVLTADFIDESSFQDHSGSRGLPVDGKEAES